MQIKNKILKLKELLIQYFFVPFFLSYICVLGLHLYLHIDNSKIYFLKTFYIISFLIISILFLLWYANLAKNEQKKIIIENINTPIFFSCILFFSFYDILKQENILFSDITFYTLIFIGVFSGIIFFINKKNLLDKLSKKTIQIKNIKKQELLLLLGIILIGFILRIWLSLHQIVTIDEVESTDLVSQGLLEYKKLGTAISGVPYTRSQIFNALNTLPYFFIDNAILQMRVMPSLAFCLGLFFIYKISKDFFTNKIFSFLTIIFLSIDWYIVSTAISARSYIWFLLLSFFSLYSLIKIYGSDNKKEKILFIIVLFISTIINLTEGQSVLAFHILPLVGIILLLDSIKTKNYKLLIYTSITTCLIFGSIFLIKPSILFYIIKKFTIEPDNIFFTGYFFYGSTLSYISSLGITIIFVSILIPFFQKEIKWKLLSIYCLLPFLQIILFSGKNSEPRYLSYIAIPLIFLFVNFISILLKQGKIHKFIGISLIILYIGTSSFNIYNLYTQKIEWQVFTNRNWEEFIDEIPQNAIVISDFPSMPQFYRDDLTIYYLRHSPTDYATVNEKGLLIDETVYKNKDTEKNDLFLNYLKNNLEPHAILFPNQEYHYTTAIPKVMNLDHLKEIKKSSQQPLYFLLSHNIFEKKYQIQEPDLYEYIFKNMEITKESFLSEAKFSTLEINKTPKRKLLLAKLSAN